MDEATSQMDKANDQMVQELIREELKDRIILSIAHRLDTIIEFDKVLVMDKGAIAEFDRPTVLLRNKKNFFSLCKNTGKDNFKRLKQMALAMERLRFPELGDLDGIDEDWVEGVDEPQEEAPVAADGAEKNEDIFEEAEEADEGDEEEPKQAPAVEAAAAKTADENGGAEEIDGDNITDGDRVL